MGSNERQVGHFNDVIGSSRISPSAYQNNSADDNVFERRRFNKTTMRVAPIQSLRTDQGHCAPEFFNHSLYQMQLLICRRYPKGNFGRNQLLDGSISLSPLYPSSTINLHVRIATSLHQSFPWLRSTQA